VCGIENGLHSVLIRGRDARENEKVRRKKGKQREQREKRDGERD
jgi:hypothetical protein